MTSAELSAVDELHHLARKTAALLRLAVSQLDELSGLAERLEDLSHLLDAAAAAADATVAAGKDLTTKAVRHGEA
jgi:hypothetical protein